MALDLHRLDRMTAPGIHRVIEQQAATRPDAVALIDGERSMTYRELNRRANVVARRLVDEGFRRASHAVVRMDRSMEAAVVLLAVLKAGGAFTCLDADDGASWPSGVSILRDHGGAEQRWQAVDVSRAAAEPGPPSPNLPIVTRRGDIACVQRDRAGRPVMLIPHDTITALADRPAAAMTSWAGESGALDLWLPLMTGATAVVSTAAPAVAAA
jgi:non-ribosomal peptide synthetase component F